MSDLVGALRSMLLADAGVTALAGQDVFGGELPGNVAPQMPKHALVIAPSGGTSLTGGSFAEADTQRVDLISYGATPNEAVALLDAASLAMRRARRKVWAGVLVHWAQPAGGFTGGRDGATTWPRAFRSFQVMHALKPL